MSCKRWHTKKDVMKDLAIATGKSVRDIHEDYVIIGEQPPPRHMADEDEEEQMLRLYGGRISSSTQDIGKPDLNGITKMLRMVDRFYERPLNVSPKDENKKVTNTLVSISKLNPNVAEFVPKNIDTCKDSNKLNKIGLDDVNKTQNQNCNVNGTSENEEEVSNKEEQSKSSLNSNNAQKINETDNVSNNSSSIDTSRLTTMEMQEMREKLKTKISGTSNAKCVRAKRERNLAISTLVKLHCETPKTTDPDEDKPKLIAPDYYQKSLSNHEKVAEEKHCIGETDNIPNSGIALVKPDVATVNSAIDKKTELLVKNTNNPCVVENKTKVYRMEAGVSDKNVQNEKPQINISPVNKDSNTEVTKEVKESIKKVESWLNSPPKKESKGPSVYLGPVTFKRKVNSKPMSPISVDSENSIIHKTESFVPSEFANQLTKKYMERNKAKEIAEQDMWTKLESELKAKDEIIKKQRLQMSNSSLETESSN